MLILLNETNVNQFKVDEDIAINSSSSGQPPFFQLIVSVTLVFLLTKYILQREKNKQSRFPVMRSGFNSSKEFRPQNHFLNKRQTNMNSSEFFSKTKFNVETEHFCSISALLFIIRLKSRKSKF